MKNRFKRIIATLLVAVLLVGSAPLECLTGIDFGGLFGIEAEAASISSDRKQITKVRPGQWIYITASNKTFNVTTRFEVRITDADIANNVFSNTQSKNFVNIIVEQYNGSGWVSVKNKKCYSNRGGVLGKAVEFNPNGSVKVEEIQNVNIKLDVDNGKYRVKIIVTENSGYDDSIGTMYGIDGGKDYIENGDYLRVDLQYHWIWGVYGAHETSGEITGCSSGDATFSNQSVSKITTTSAKISANIVNKNNVKIVKYGYKAWPLIGSSKSSTQSCNFSDSSKPVSFSTSQLIPATKYWYQVFAVTAEGNTYYSSIKSFKTLLPKPLKTVIEQIKKYVYGQSSISNNSLQDNLISTNSFAELAPAFAANSVVTNANGNIVKVSATDVGIGDVVDVSWSKSQYAEYYKLSINGVEQPKIIRGLNDSLTLTQVGANDIRVQAYNESGASGWSNPATVIVHPDVNITFYKDGEVYQKNTLTWGHDFVKMPELPAKKGNAFTGWSNLDGTAPADFTEIKADLNAYAGYTPSKFTVKFVNPNGDLLSTQIVEYGKPATEPEDKTSFLDENTVFVGWNKDYSRVTSNMTITAVTDAKNYDIPVVVTNVNSVRYEKNYVVTCTVSNLTRKEVEHGRVIVALKTAEGKLVTTTESAAYFLDANYTDVNGDEVFNSENIKVTIPILDQSDGSKQVTATVAEVYAIKEYQTTVPISQLVVDDEIEDRDPWTAWTLEENNNYNAENTQELIQYRSRDIMITTTTNLAERDRLIAEDDWTLHETTSAKDKNSGTWSRTKPAGVLNTDYAQKTVTDKAAYTEYRYKRYIYYNAAAGCNYISYADGWANNMGYTGSWGYITTSSPLGYINQYDGWYQYSGYWFSNGSSRTNPAVSVAAKTHIEYRAFDTIYTYHLNKWPDNFSDWTTTPIAEISNKVDVETRTIYRYKKADIERVEDNSGVVRTDFTVGSLGTEFAGKQVTLFIYKINEASDWTTEHIAQTTVDENGNYFFEPYKLREEPSEITGDMTVVLGIEGAEKAMYIGTIEAPKPQYTVTFIDDISGEVLSTQTVEEGMDAVIPEALAHEGYTFSYWNNCSTNVKQNLEVRAMYDVNQYTVVWIDYVQERYDVEVYEHGESLLPPFGLYESCELIADGWDKITSENPVPVTSNMVITAQYLYTTFNVDFLDENGDVIESQRVRYGECPEFPQFDYENFDNLVFCGFSSKQESDELDPQNVLAVQETEVSGEEPSSDEIGVESETDYIDVDDYQVYADCIIEPKFIYAETTATPYADITTGTYDAAQTVTLSCDTENSLIFYTLDGSNPVTNENALTYTAPITIDNSCELRFFAECVNMNSSDVGSEFYAINGGPGSNKYILKLAFDNTDDVVYTGIVDAGTKLDEAMIPEIDGHTLEGVYRTLNYIPAEQEDLEGTVEYADPWNIETDTITADTTLYLKYNVESYTVEFVDFDGFVFDTQTVEYYSSAAAPEDPVREGYVFTGWDSESYLAVTGDTTVTATYVPEDEYVSVSLDRAKYTMMSGSSYTLTATTTGNVENPELIWSSSDDSVATVDEKGNITAVGKGTCQIAVSVADNAEIAICTLTVWGNPTREICLKDNTNISVDEATGFIGGFRVVTDEDTGLHHSQTVSEIRENFSNDALVFVSSSGDVLADTDYIGTGTTIKLMDGDSELDAVTVILSGDMDGNGYVNNRDAARISRYLVNKETPDAAQLTAIDVNGDGYVNNRDASLISRYLVGKEAI